MQLAPPGRVRHVLIVVLAVGLSACGRIGVELIPFDLDRDGGGGGFDPDGGDIPEDDGGVADGGNGADANGNDGALGADGSADTGPDEDASLCVDTSGDGVPDQCSCNMATFTPTTSCGVGFCSSNATASRCVGGVEEACVPGSPRSATDTTCDGIDDNCNGTTDENYAPVTQCGVGYCRTTATASRCSAGAVVACTPGAPRASNDTTADGVDDDCDGMVDEDACMARTDTYRAGTFTLSPPAGCNTVTVKLWGGAGAAGDAEAGYWNSVTGGSGGAGGYVDGTFTVATGGMLQLYVGGGGKGCGTMIGTGALAAHNGGRGGVARGEAGTAGADGTRTGGAAGSSASGGRGGAGSNGGGGGGAGTDPVFAPHGDGGGGGAATVLVINSMTLVAGGGGGGGGAGSEITTAGHSGGSGGSGCNVAGQASADIGVGGGGGGGGACVGPRTMAGNGRTPADPGANLTGNMARGGNPATDCDPGGDGVAIISYSR